MIAFIWSLNGLRRVEVNPLRQFRKSERGLPVVVRFKGASELTLVSGFVQKPFVGKIKEEVA
jgi:hypothetical protein